MRLKQLQYVVEVAKCKSFSKAGKKLYVAQPSLSTSISALESELGITIFHRTPQGAIITEDGEKVLAQAEIILANVDKLAHISDGKPSRYSATLAAVPAACNALVISLLAILAKNHPEISLNIIEIRPQKVLSSISNGLADIVIGSYTHANEKQVLIDAKKNNIVIENLMQDYLYAYLPRNHPLAGKNFVTLQDLSNERQAVFNDFILIEGNDASCCESRDTSDCYTFSDRSSIKQTVANGLAYAILPHQMALDDIYVSSGLIKAVPIADSYAPVTSYLAWRKSNYTPLAESIILDYIRQLFKTAEERLNKLTTFIKKDNISASAMRY